MNDYPLFTMHGTVKPRVRKILSGTWYCGLDFYAEFVRFNGRDPFASMAETPQAAYRKWAWLKEMATQPKVLTSAAPGLAMNVKRFDGLMTELPSFPQQVYA